MPLKRTQIAITQLGGLGRLTSEQVSSQDLEKVVAQQNSQIGSLQRSIAVYKQALLSGTLSATDRIRVQIQLANAQHQLTATRTSHSHTVLYGKTANITLNLSESRTLLAAKAAATLPQAPGRLGQMLHNVGHTLGTEAIVLTYILLIVGPIVLVGALIWWFTTGRRRRDEKNLLASA